LCYVIRSQSSTRETAHLKVFTIHDTKTVAFATHSTKTDGQAQQQVIPATFFPFSNHELSVESSVARIVTCWNRKDNSFITQRQYHRLTERSYIALATAVSKHNHRRRRAVGAGCQCGDAGRQVCCDRACVYNFQFNVTVKSARIYQAQLD